MSTIEENLFISHLDQNGGSEFSSYEIELQNRVTQK